MGEFWIGLKNNGQTHNQKPFQIQNQHLQSQKRTNEIPRYPGYSTEKNSKAKLI
jgi:hypothetical protein